MQNHVMLEAYEQMIQSLSDYADDIQNGTTAMSTAVEVCREAMGSDEYSMSIVKNLEDCLNEYKVLIQLLGEEVDYLQRERDAISKIKY